MPKSHVVTFASSDLKKSLRRLGNQAIEMNFFSSIHVCTEKNLTADFHKTHKSLLRIGKRGYGYWIWKPRIILDVLSKLPSGDSLLYIDAGCHLNPTGRNRLKEYFEILEKSEIGLIAFQHKPPTEPFIYDGRTLPDLKDRYWTKGDLLDHFGVRQDETITETQTIGAGIILIRNVPQAVDFLENWLALMEQNIFFLDDSESKSDNLLGFRENRHDQAFFSILCKLAKVPTLSCYEFWYPNIQNTGPDWEALENYPIHARRDKKFSRTSKLLKKIRKKLTRYNLI